LAELRPSGERLETLIVSHLFRKPTLASPESGRSTPRIRLGNEPLQSGRQFTRELCSRYFFAAANVLARPQRREITGALAFGLGAQGARAAIANGKASVASRQAAEMALSHYLDDFNLDDFKEQSGGPHRA
jgi:hypothetical protein